MSLSKLFKAKEAVTEAQKEATDRQLHIVKQTRELQKELERAAITSYGPILAGAVTAFPEPQAADVSDLEDIVLYNLNGSLYVMNTTSHTVYTLNEYGTRWHRTATTASHVIANGYRVSDLSNLLIKLDESLNKANECQCS